MLGPLPLMQVQFGLMATGFGAVEIMYMSAVTGQGLGQDGYGYVAAGIMDLEVTHGTEGAGDKSTAPDLRLLAEKFIKQKPLIQY